MEIRKGKKALLKEVFDTISQREYYYKPIDENEFNYHLNKETITDDDVFYAVIEEKIVGYGICYHKEMAGFIEGIFVHPDYQNQKIGSQILKEMENHLRNLGVQSIRVSSFYPWFIPNTDHHDHPNTPGIRYNSKEYFFFLSNKYHVIGHLDAFYLKLENYELDKSILEILKRNKENGLKIELYQKGVHHGFDAFYQDINNPGFEKSIKYNLSLEKPNPFLVVANDKNEVLGWTGAIYNEESGRGHFDGIAISNSIRGLGLGKALFAMLAYESKKNGAKFMSFYTGLTNHARYIYLGAGFKIVQSFAIFEKKL